ncbi:MAG TPA: glycosyltransferase family 2 protein [Vicinamibacterales bacterium]|nr:glycosyltransferase family 2 protein [Vicinamibacterales bacterium]
MPDTPGVSVCFPVYNEEQTLRAVLDDARTFLADSRIDYEILICDDGSTDETPAIIRAFAGEDARIRAWRHSRNLGIFATFEDLYAHAAKEFVFLNSTDEQWNTRILLDLLPLTAAADVVIASRRDKHYPPVRRAVSWAFNALPTLLFGVRTYDAGAVKLMRRDIITRCAIVSRSPFAEAERLIRAARLGYRIVDYPVDTKPRRGGQGHGADRRVMWAAVVDLVRVWVALH